MQLTWFQALSDFTRIFENYPWYKIINKEIIQQTKILNLIKRLKLNPNL